MLSTSTHSCVGADIVAPVQLSKNNNLHNIFFCLEYLTRFLHMI